MRMEEAMTALSGGKAIDTSSFLGGATKGPADAGGSGGTATKSRGERQVSLG